MRPKHNPILLAIFALALVSLACQALSGSGTQTPATEAPQQPTPQEAIPTEGPSQPSVEPATVSSQGAGVLCVGSTTGLSCLNENGWQSYTDENSELPNNYLY